MADILWVDVTGVAPELSSVPVAAQDLYLENSNAHFDANVMGGEASANLKLARIYHAAHAATVAKYASDGVTGAVSEIQLGDERTKFGPTITLSSDDPLDASAYGKLLNQLVRETPLARLPILL